MNEEKAPYDELINQIGNQFKNGRKQAIQYVNIILVQTYWHIGQQIVEFEKKREMNEQNMVLNFSNGFQKT